MDTEIFTRHRTIQALIIRACFLSAVSLVSSERAFAQPMPERSNENTFSSYMLSLVNEDRHEHGSPALEENSKLDHLAQVYADYLLRSGFFGHLDPFGRSPQDRAALFGVKTGVSENLAWESSNFEDAPVLIRRAETGMMNEPAKQLNHRYNILNPESRFIGIGVARSGDKVLMVQEFAGEEP